ncbi:MAG: FtsQ-type POTRA domain-containing protein [Nitrospirota bacterium]
MTTATLAVHKKKGVKEDVQKGKPWTKILMSFLPVILILFSFYSLSSSSYLQIKEIRWSGLSRIDVQVLDQQFQSVLGQNLIRLSIADLHKTLITNRWIKEVVVRKVFPNRLDILVTERVPAAVEIDPSSHRMLIRDNEGIILEEGKEDHLPQVIYYNPNVYTKAMELAPLLSKRKDALIDLSRSDNVSVRFKKGVLHMGDTDLKKRWDRFSQVEANLDSRKIAPWEADLRFPSQVVVKSKNKTANEKVNTASAEATEE